MLRPDPAHAERPSARADTSARQRSSEALPGSAEFLRGFLRNPAQVGSVIPSSRQLEQRLVRSANLAKASTVVELGPGTGGTTLAMLRALPPEARLLAIELDEKFHRHLLQTVHDPRLLLRMGSAERMEEFLRDLQMAAPDAIVSGIPFSTMPAHACQRIARSIAQVLRPGGRFVAYQVRAHVADYMRPHLGEPEMAWEMVNIPPVRVFSWVKPSSSR